MSIQTLGKRWVSLWQNLQAQGDPLEVFNLLLKHYHEPHRRYHNLAHIYHCLTELDEISHFSTNPKILAWAVWFHDAIYQPSLVKPFRDQSDEEESVDLAIGVAQKAGLNNQFCEQVRQLILVTQHFAVTPQTSEEKLMVDIDLAILGAEPSVFDRYCQQIRAEYSFVLEELFIQGRLRILRSFLECPSIFQTKHFQNKYEHQARINLTRAIVDLERRINNKK